MKLIGLISDTHGFLDSRFIYHLKNCDEIWHAGDIGSQEVAEKLKAIAPSMIKDGDNLNHLLSSEILKPFAKLRTSRKFKIYVRTSRCFYYPYWRLSW